MATVEEKAEALDWLEQRGIATYIELRAIQHEGEIEWQLSAGNHAAGMFHARASTLFELVRIASHCLRDTSEATP